MTLPRPPRIFYFDKDRGAEATIRALGGRYACLRPDDATGFNPFAEAIDARGQAWLRDWITARLPKTADTAAARCDCRGGGYERRSLARPAPVP